MYYVNRAWFRALVAPVAGYTPSAITEDRPNFSGSRRLAARAAVGLKSDRRYQTKLLAMLSEQVAQGGNRPRNQISAGATGIKFAAWRSFSAGAASLQIALERRSAPTSLKNSRLHSHQRDCGSENENVISPAPL